MSTLEAIAKTAKSLPADKQAELLDFAEFLHLRAERSSAYKGGELTPLPILPGFVPSGWKDAIYGER